MVVVNNKIEFWKKKTEIENDLVCIKIRNFSNSLNITWSQAECEGYGNNNKLGNKSWKFVKEQWNVFYEKYVRNICQELLVLQLQALPLKKC